MSTYAKQALAVTGLTLTLHAAIADEQKQFVYKTAMPHKAVIPPWVPISLTLEAWQNIGSPVACTSWTPAPSTVNLAEAFSQSRTCTQPQQRDATPVLYNAVLKSTKLGATYRLDGQVSVQQAQPSTGTRDFITGEYVDPWSVWASIGIPYDCGEWSPSPSTVRLNESFTQSRSCQQEQRRNRQVFHTWASGQQTPKRIDEGTQAIMIEAQQGATGTQDEIHGLRVGAWSSWATTGPLDNCGNWTPATSTYNAGQWFTQTQQCQQPQKRSRQLYDVWLSGQETVLRTEDEEQLKWITRSRSALGTKKTLRWAYIQTHSRVTETFFTDCWDTPGEYYNVPLMQGSDAGQVCDEDGATRYVASGIYSYHRRTSYQRVGCYVWGDERRNAQEFRCQ